MLVSYSTKLSSQYKSSDDIPNFYDQRLFQQQQRPQSHFLKEVQEVTKYFGDIWKKACR